MALVRRTTRNPPPMVARRSFVGEAGHTRPQAPCLTRVAILSGWPSRTCQEKTTAARRFFRAAGGTWRVRGTSAGGKRRGRRAARAMLGARPCACRSLPRAAHSPAARARAASRCRLACGRVSRDSTRATLFAGPLERRDHGGGDVTRTPAVRRPSDGRADGHVPCGPVSPFCHTHDGSAVGRWASRVLGERSTSPWKQSVSLLRRVIEPDLRGVHALAGWPGIVPRRQARSK